MRCVAKTGIDRGADGGRGPGSSGLGEKLAPTGGPGPPPPPPPPGGAALALRRKRARGPCWRDPGACKLAARMGDAKRKPGPNEDLGTAPLSSRLSGGSNAFHWQRSSEAARRRRGRNGASKSKRSPGGHIRRVRNGEGGPKAAGQDTRQAGMVRAAALSKVGPLARGFGPWLVGWIGAYRAKRQGRGGKKQGPPTMGADPRKAPGFIRPIGAPQPPRLPAPDFRNPRPARARKKRFPGNPRSGVSLDP